MTPITERDRARAKEVEYSDAGRFVFPKMRAKLGDVCVDDVIEEIASALAQAREGRISEDDKKMAEELVAQDNKVCCRDCVAKALATVRADEKAKYEKEILDEKQKRVDGYNLGVDDGKAEAREEYEKLVEGLREAVEKSEVWLSRQDMFKRDPTSVQEGFAKAKKSALAAFDEARGKAIDSLIEGKV